ncbi:MAG: C2 family cysteine protease [Tepidisphaeraceae bacterium]
MLSTRVSRLASASALVLACYGGLARADLAGQIETNFVQWDADHDQQLTLAELDVAVADPAVKSEAAAAAVALRRAARGATGNAGPLTREAIDALLHSPSTRPASTQPDVDQTGLNESDPDTAPRKPGTGPRLETLYRAALARVGAASHRKLFGERGPSIAGIRQGRIGDCFCLAPLAAMVHRDPASITQRITTNDDGTFTVRLGDEAVTVTAPTDGELALGNAEASTGIWVNVYEKAVGQSRQKTDADGNRTSTPLATASRGGSAGTQLQVLTGHAIQRFSCKPFRDGSVDAAQQSTLLGDLRILITETRAAHRLIVCGTGANVKVPGVTSNHAYAVLDYDPKADAVTLWNPHANDFTPKGEAGLAHGYPMHDGVFTVPLAEVVKFQGGFSFEQATAAK